ncbi:response regulator [Chromobacterium sinusclupearum]|uniref:Response regulator n=1 Tax=Chromobacterium sinusclupearum TaxID=2077146 RepID=A0A2K4MHW7_9NEIS|nr:response regulator [Chromobacterium sinusclupearum]POA96671.1 response regulator [Chromobacterium sinusclupearum]
MQPTILVVDDHEINRKVAAMFLKKQGWLVEQAESGFQALEMFQRALYDCVLLDISMPDMSGIEVCRQVRADPRMRGMRLVAYTAHAMADEQDEIMQSGFDAMVTKPLTAERLFEAVSLAGRTA